MKQYKLMVIIRDDSPLIFCGDSSSYRSVNIVLTDHQCEQLQLKKVGVNCNTEIFENISSCFLEELK